MGKNYLGGSRKSERCWGEDGRRLFRTRHIHSGKKRNERKKEEMALVVQRATMGGQGMGQKRGGGGEQGFEKERRAIVRRFGDGMDG